MSFFFSLWQEKYWEHNGVRFFFIRKYFERYSRYHMHTLQKVWTPLSRKPPCMAIPPPSFLSFFLKAQLLTTLFFWHDRPYEIPDKQKNKLMWQSHFFIFRRLKNDVTCVFISNTFISNTSNLLSKEHYYYKIHTYIINEKQRLHSPRSSFIDNPSNVDDPSFLQENLDRSYDFPKISTPYK